MLSLLRFRSGLAVVLFGLALVTAARAQVTLTITATANSDAFTTGNGYVANNAYTFTFTMPGSYPDNPDSHFVAANQAVWQDDDTSADANLFTSISGSGVGGAFVRPTTDTTSPFSYVETSGGNLIIHAASDDSAPNSIGLTTLSSTVLGSITVNAGNSAAFSQGDTYIDPVSYFAPYAGIYSSATGTVVLLDGTANSVGTFTIKSLTITAIPEPSTYAALAGLAALGLVALRRRRLAA